MSPPVYAWICTAGGLVLLLALDHRWRALDVRHHGARLSGSVLLGLLTGCVVLAVAGPDAGGDFLAHWAVACASVLDTAVILSLVAVMAGSPSRAVLVVAIGLSAVLRAGLPAGGPAASWATAPSGVALVVLGGWFFLGAEAGTPAAPRMRIGWGLLAGCGAVALFAWTSVSAVADPGYLSFLANMTAIVTLRPLFLLMHATLGRGEWSRIGMAVLAGFTGTKLLGSVVLPGAVLASVGLVVLTAVVVALVLGAVVLPSWCSATSTRVPTGHPTD